MRRLKIDLLTAYWPAIAASSVLAAGLALLGAQLAARDWVLQSFCVGQGAMLGVLVGLGAMLTWFQEDQLSLGLPFGGAVLFAALAYLGGEWLARGDQGASQTTLAAYYALLSAAGLMVGAWVPALEGHLAQRYFGDLATIGGASAWLMGAGGSGLLLAMIGQARPLARASFLAAVRGEAAGRPSLVLSLATVLGLCFAVQFAGFLYTVACLFVPTALLARGAGRPWQDASLARPGLTRHLAWCGGVAVLGVASGFCASLAASRLPTVPAVVLGLGVFGALASRPRLRRRRPS